MPINGASASLIKDGIPEAQPEYPVFAKPALPVRPEGKRTCSALGSAEETGVPSLTTLIVAPFSACHPVRDAAEVPGETSWKALFLSTCKIVSAAECLVEEDSKPYVRRIDLHRRSLWTVNHLLPGPMTMNLHTRNPVRLSSSMMPLVSTHVDVLVDWE